MNKTSLDWIDRAGTIDLNYDQDILLGYLTEWKGVWEWHSVGWNHVIDVPPGPDKRAAQEYVEKQIKAAL